VNEKSTPNGEPEFNKKSQSLPIKSPPTIDYKKK
jgi:hypothetical protein